MATLTSTRKWYVLPAAYGMTAAAAKALPLRASMLPLGLKRTSVAKPVYAVCAPRENATTLLVGDADGVASNCAVNDPVWLTNAVFCQPLVGDAVAQPNPCGLTVTAMSSLADSTPSLAVRRRT